MSSNNQPISGILNINKAAGLTSHDVVARIRKLSGIRRVGHTGTLDPLATGVLVVCLGQATRLIEYMTAGQKRYQATIRFGATTDTLDAEGEIVEQSDPSGLTETHLRELLPNFIGEIKQTPPIFSALKRDGQPLYKAARAGKTVELEPRLVTIEALKWLDWASPVLTLDVSCSAGTYIRALARDLGEAAGTGAYLEALTRTANHQWRLDEAVALDTLERETRLDPSAWQNYVYPLDQAVYHLSKVTLNEKNSADVKHGRRVQIVEPQIANYNPDLPLLRAYDTDGKFMAILVQAEADIWQPKKVFQT